jgi:hypothetical protein
MANPEISPALIEMLAERYPDRCPALTMSDREVWHAAGAASVVDFLKQLFAEQQENILENP